MSCNSLLSGLLLWLALLFPLIYYCELQFSSFCSTTVLQFSSLWSTTVNCTSLLSGLPLCLQFSSIWSTTMFAILFSLVYYYVLHFSLAYYLVSCRRFKSIHIIARLFSELRELKMSHHFFTTFILTCLQENTRYFLFRPKYQSDLTGVYTPAKSARSYSHIHNQILTFSLFSSSDSHILNIF